MNQKSTHKKPDAVQIVVVYHNIKLSVGHLGLHDQVMVPRQEAEAIVALDEKAGRTARIIIVKDLK